VATNASGTGGTPASDLARLDVEFRGRVQGVGFRATAVSVVTHYTIHGYVINLRGGGVRLVAEGSRATVSRAIQELRDRMKGNIQDSTESWGAATGEFSGFQVRYEDR
jgi:acylphosphatase